MIRNCTYFTVSWQSVHIQIVCFHDHELWIFECLLTVSRASFLDVHWSVDLHISAIPDQYIIIFKALLISRHSIMMKMMTWMYLTCHCCRLHWSNGKWCISWYRKIKVESRPTERSLGYQKRQKCRIINWRNQWNDWLCVYNLNIYTINHCTLQIFFVSVIRTKT